MMGEYYVYMAVLYFAIVFARKKVDIRVSLFGAFLVATLTKLGSIGTINFFHTVLYEVIMFMISFVVLGLTYNMGKMSKLVYIVEVLVAIGLVYVYANLGAIIFSM